ncbi:MAG: beta-N-acetylhexosaminidase [Oscillospiraceae bacterium]
MLKYNIIPKPNNYTSLEGTYVVSSSTAVLCSEDFVNAGNYLTEYLKTKPTENGGSIKIKKVAGMERDAYSLKVSNDGIVINASDSCGAFYGAVTLKIILMQANKVDGKAVVNCLFIDDKPVYGYRGVMVDESRHFFGMDVIKEILDVLAMLKINTFHWHLSDDQGFRIESKLFPLLNEISSTRKYAGLEGCTLKHRGGEYSFFYTQEEIKEIVAFAKKLNINVLPEIDLPGHMTAVLAAYPQYGCTGKEYEVACQNGIFDAVLCAGSEDALDFVDKLLGEICPLFDYKYFHIGGDEASEGHKLWNKCPKCTAVMEKQGLKNASALQGYYMSQVNNILKKYGKTTIAWNDCINDDFDESIVCQYWILSNSKDVDAQSYKRDMILSPHTYFYFDVKYASTSLKKVYNFNEVKIGFGKSGQRVLGIECEHWTEWIDSKTALEFAMFPRVFAMAEVAWTALPNRRFKDFKKRLEWFKTYLDKKDIYYSRVDGKKHGTANPVHYHLGTDGKEFKKSERIKNANK